MNSADQHDLQAKVRLRLVVDDVAFSALTDEWNALADNGTRRSVFLTHDWFDAAWQWRKLTSALRVMCLYRGEQLLAILPLVLEGGPSATSRVRRLEFLTVPDTQLCDMIVGDADRELAAREFAAELHRRRGEWDVLRLRYLPEQSVAATSLRTALAAKGCSSTVTPGADNPYVPLDTSWNEYYATRTRSLKKANNLAANRLKKAGEVAIEWLATEACEAGEMARFVEAAIDISRRSWKTETGNSLDNPGPQAFFRRLSELARDRGWLSVWLLSLDGKPFAMEYELVADGDVFALRSDFDAECERLQISPGSYLSRHLLEQLFGRGLKRYFMGPGNNAYKYRWTDQTAATFDMTVYSGALRGRLLGAWETSLKPAIRRVRDRAKPVQPAEAAEESAD
jgi:CelD/BcsL family acetyltransferase involved in cellulose biosynthesis